MQEIWVWSLGQEDPLEKGMASHSGILAWRIPWTVLSDFYFHFPGSHLLRAEWAADNKQMSEKMVGMSDGEN